MLRRPRFAVGDDRDHLPPEQGGDVAPVRAEAVRHAVDDLQREVGVLRGAAFFAVFGGDGEAEQLHLIAHLVGKASPAFEVVGADMAFVHDHIQPTVHLGTDDEVDLRVDMWLDGAVKAVPVGEAQVVGADDLYAFGGEVGVDVGGLAGTRQAAGKVECLHGGCILFYNVGNGESGEGDGDVPHDVGEVGGVVARPFEDLAVFAFDGLSVRAELRHVRGVDAAGRLR